MEFTREELAAISRACDSAAEEYRNKANGAALSKQDTAAGHLLREAMKVELISARLESELASTEAQPAPARADEYDLM